MSQDFYPKVEDVKKWTTPIKTNNMKKVVIRIHLNKWYLLPTKTLQYSSCVNCNDEDYTWLCFTLQLK